MVDFSLPQLLNFVLIFGGSRPNAILDSLSRPLGTL